LSNPPLSSRGLWTCARPQRRRGGPYDSGLYAAERRQLTVDEDPDPVERCPNCEGDDHELKDCLQADRETGRLPGCAYCNALHRMGSCARFRALSLEQQYEIVVLERGRMPPLETDEHWIHTLQAYDLQATRSLPTPMYLPWSQTFSRNWVRNANTRMRLTMAEYYTKRSRSRLPVDRSTETLKLAMHHYGIAGSLRHIGVPNARSMGHTPEQQLPLVQTRSEAITPVLQAPAPSTARPAQAPVPARSNQASRHHMFMRTSNHSSTATRGSGGSLAARSPDLDVARPDVQDPVDSEQFDVNEYPGPRFAMRHHDRQC